MRSIVSVTAAAETPYRLTTLERIKRELGISDGGSDDLLQNKIDEAGSDIQAALGFVVARETVTETFRGGGCEASLPLNRTPVATITSVTVDDVALAASEYEVETATGILHRLDTSGYPVAWEFCRAIVVVYAGGYILPGNAGANLEPAIEAGCIDLVSAFWAARGRDPMVRAEDIPDVMRTEYWVGSVGEAGDLPPSVMAKIARFRRPAA